MIHLVITFTGPDRPGLVHALSQAVAGHHGSWLDSRMASLAGRFTGILEVAVPEAHLQALVVALEAVEGLSLQLERGEAAPPVPVSQLEVTGHDREGIVRDVTAVLVQAGVNIEELESTTMSAPMSGEALFVAVVQLRLPDGLDADALIASIEALADDLVVELDRAAG